MSEHEPYAPPAAPLREPHEARTGSLWGGAFLALFALFGGYLLLTLVGPHVAVRRVGAVGSEMMFGPALALLLLPFVLVLVLRWRRGEWRTIAGMGLAVLAMVVGAVVAFLR